MHDRLKRTARKRGNRLRAKPIIEAHMKRAVNGDALAIKDYPNLYNYVHEAWQRERDTMCTLLGFNAWFIEQWQMYSAKGLTFPPADTGQPMTVYRPIGPIGYLNADGPGRAPERRRSVDPKWITIS
jgi:hypothetical protein